MRKLHPPGPREQRVHRGIYRSEDGTSQEWMVHTMAGGRHVIRVDTGTDLWHLSLGENGLPERLQARLREGDRTLDVTYTFFPDEALIWRRGGGDESDAVELPGGCQVLWPVMPGRGLLLAGALGEADRCSGPVVWLDRVPLDDGGLQERVETVVLARTPEGVTMHGPGQRICRVELDDSGHLAAWYEETRAEGAGAPATDTTTEEDA